VIALLAAMVGVGEVNSLLDVWGPSWRYRASPISSQFGNIEERIRS
jgi:hypothetical protein